MFVRQTRRSLALHRTTALRSIGLPSRSLPSHITATNLGRRCVVSQPYQPRKRRGSESGPGLNHGRNLATAVDDYNFGHNLGALHSQLASSGLQPFQAPPPPPSYSDLRSLDPTSLLTIPEPVAPRQFGKINNKGVPGEVEEMIPVFDACVRVGKLDRASLVLKRLNLTGLLPGEEMIILHNQYLRASLDQLRTNPDRKQAELLHKWYELQIRNQNIPQTAETIACMLKASLISERGARLERLINRYMSMAPDEAGLRVLSRADILSDQDLGVITEICPTYRVEPGSEESYVSLASEEEGLELEEDLNDDMAAFASEDYPEVRPTPQRGGGLNSLRRNLNLMAELQNVDISKLDPLEQREFQMRLEKDSIDTAIEKWRTAKKKMDKMGINTALNAKSEDNSLADCLQRWLVAMEARLREEIIKVEESEEKEVKSEEDLERCIYGPILRMADPTRMAAVTILTLLNISALQGVDKGVVIQRLLNDVSRVAQDDIQTQLKEKAAKERRRLRKVQFLAGEKETVAAGPKEPVKATKPIDAKESTEANASTEVMEADAPTETNERVRQKIITDAYEPTGAKDPVLSPWSIQVRARIGSILLKSLIETAKVNVVKEHPISKERISQLQPAFSHMQAPKKGKKVGMLTINPELVDRLKREPMGDFLAKHLPMIAEPRPWTRINEGGFLMSRASLIRVKSGDVEQKLYANAAIKRGDMDQVFKGLDVLGKTPWRVNNPVLDVMVEAWNSGDAIANMPELTPNLEMPPEPTNSDPLLRRAWIRKVKQVENERGALHSQRCYMNLQLEIARAFRKQVVYFPHNMDYRGRAYPIPTYLNHMGADHTRALLKFAEGKRLGQQGLRWLKIHLANLYGFDKASFDEREAFATDNLANIRESVENPLNGSRWWLKAEDPWQCLATCFELKAAYDLPDPTDFVSNLPVHQDGTCNGLQHYAALGGDTWGAQQVNLMPSDRPADVYSAVANLVKESIEKDAEAGSQLGKNCLGKITRKVVKQTVMTNVYGVTFSGAKQQVCKQLDALYPEMYKETGIPNLVTATYIAQHIFNALGTMFRGAHDIQYWLGEIGARVCKALTLAQLDQLQEEKDNKPAARKTAAGKTKELDELTSQFRSTVVWTTPLRMPVVQPYRKAITREIRTCLQSISYPTQGQTEPVDRRKQLQGFPPNFIHSLDASHMLLSALKCDELGLKFAAVHDSFWTHAADVDILSGVLRDAFIRIHEEDVVGRLAAEFEARYRGSLYLANIPNTSAAAAKIREFRKTSKLTQTEEVLLEHKRNSLLRSGNPWDVEAAKKIITPASIVEAMPAEQQEDPEIEKETEDIGGLGHIPESEGNLSSAVQEAVKSMEPAEDKFAEISNGLLERLKHTSFEVKVIQPKKESKQRWKKVTHFWRPLTFPDLPKKGDFDVRQLRQSQYFFS
ncbi:DNA-directed RNA polymerase mitochondrial [Fusarium subglutinans]|uniref:DNA-directed RNA polymerase n=1 Tax=Gibberella subglutinans TaxID=42677 RepID=A0A8H5V497_GIBSU|nr:DNA-directed RNA polymerase mitochondrial [Fusarium subglutinans]KAF5610442.1 DNA-directed RNA polymerase mitochondrial [Fusarium subglutinans]